MLDVVPADVDRVRALLHPMVLCMLRDSKSLPHVELDVLMLGFVAQQESHSDGVKRVGADFGGEVAVPDAAVCACVCVCCVRVVVFADRCRLRLPWEPLLWFLT